MANINKEIDIRFNAIVTGEEKLNKLQKKIFLMQQTANRLTKDGFAGSAGSMKKRIADSKTEATLSKFALADEKRRLNVMERSRKEATKFKMEYLGLMFGFMAIGKAADKAWKSMVKTYTDVMGENNKFIKQTNKLRAAWEFFKFSLVDALMQGDLFKNIIDSVVGIVDWMSNLIGLYPGVARFIAGFVLFGKILAPIISGLASMALLWNSMKTFAVMKGLLGVGGAVAGAGAAGAAGAGEVGAGAAAGGGGVLGTLAQVLIPIGLGALGGAAVAKTVGMEWEKGALIGGIASAMGLATIAIATGAAPGLAIAIPVALLLAGIGVGSYALGEQLAKGLASNFADDFREELEVQFGTMTTLGTDSLRGIRGSSLTQQEYKDFDDVSTRPFVGARWGGETPEEMINDFLAKPIPGTIPGEEYNPYTRQREQFNPFKSDDELGGGKNITGPFFDTIKDIDDSLGDDGLKGNIDIISDAFVAEKGLRAAIDEVGGALNTGSDSLTELAGKTSTEFKDDLIPATDDTTTAFISLQAKVNSVDFSNLGGGGGGGTVPNPPVYGPIYYPPNDDDESGFATGGIVPRTGTYMLHGGEMVTPKQSMFSAGGINITVNTGPVGSDVDIRHLADEVSSVIVDELRRTAQIGGL